MSGASQDGCDIQVPADAVPLGEGANTIAYRMPAHDPRWPFPVVARVLKYPEEDEGEAEDELAVLTAASRYPHCHPNMTCLVDACPPQRTFEQLINGQNLYEETEPFIDSFLGRPLTIWEMCRVAQHLLLAVRDLHRSGSAHRDIKGNNVMVHWDEGATRDAWVVKLIDFGLACRTDCDRTGAGTGPFMPPEVLDPRTLSYGSTHDEQRPRAWTWLRTAQAHDVWSCGVLLWELAHGVNVDRGGLHPSLLLKHNLIERVGRRAVWRWIDPTTTIKALTANPRQGGTAEEDRAWERFYRLLDGLLQPDMHARLTAHGASAAADALSLPTASAGAAPVAARGSRHRPRRAARSDADAPPPPLPSVGTLQRAPALPRRSSRQRVRRAAVGHASFTPSTLTRQCTAMVADGRGNARRCKRPRRAGHVACAQHSQS